MEWKHHPDGYVWRWRVKGDPEPTEKPGGVEYWRDTEVSGVFCSQKARKVFAWDLPHASAYDALRPRENNGDDLSKALLLAQRLARKK